MNRLELRGDIYPRGVLRVCQDVHMTSTGSLTREWPLQKSDILLLQKVIDTWDSTNESEYDMIVKRLVATAMVESWK